MKLIAATLALLLALTPGIALANCATQTVFLPNGKVMFCTTCCYGEGAFRNCTTTCIGG